MRSVAARALIMILLTVFGRNDVDIQGMGFAFVFSVVTWRGREREREEASCILLTRSAL